MAAIADTPDFRGFIGPDTLGGGPLQTWRIAMAGEIPDLIAEARAGTGKGAARQARREGKVPGIVYGGGADPLADPDPLQRNC
jgi:hypothetical protein